MQHSLKGMSETGDSLENRSISPKKCLADCQDLVCYPSPSSQLWQPCVTASTAWNFWNAPTSTTAAQRIRDEKPPARRFPFLRTYEWDSMKVLKEHTKGIFKQHWKFLSTPFPLLFRLCLVLFCVVLTQVSGKILSTISPSLGLLDASGSWWDFRGDLHSKNWDRPALPKWSPKWRISFFFHFRVKPEGFTDWNESFPHHPPLPRSTSTWWGSIWTAKFRWISLPLRRSRSWFCPDPNWILTGSLGARFNEASTDRTEIHQK